MSAILYREFLLFKRQFWKISAAAAVSPTLYLLAFGWGLGRRVELPGQSYISFIVPGIMALATMNVSFSAVSVKLNTERNYEKNLELFLASPLRMYSFALAKIFAGALRGLYSAALIVCLAFFFGVRLHFSGLLVLLIVLNCMIFAALGFFAGMTTGSHQELNRFNSFFLVPMSFLCGTFFPLEQLPFVARLAIDLLPLTYASGGIRAAAEGKSVLPDVPVVLALFFLLFLSLGLWRCYRMDDF